MKPFLLAAFVGFLLIANSVAIAHPSDDKTPAQLPDWYGEPLRLDSSASFGRVQFVDAFPEVADLSDTEKYMIAGTEYSLLRGPGYGPWYLEIMNYCMYCARTGGEIPAILDPSLFAFDAEYGDTSVSEVFRNPLTNEYPRLDAQTFSPGDLLVFPLNESEMQFYADNYGYRSAWFLDDGSLNPSLQGQVFFVRMYGEDEVIWQNLHYLLRAE